MRHESIEVTFGQKTSNGKALDPKLETTDTMKAVAYIDGIGFEVPVNVRWYMGRSASASVVRCSVWIRSTDGRSWSGSGKAGGSGYCKRSASFSDAIDSAGIKLSVDVHGSGMSIVEEAVKAIASRLEPDGTPMTVVRS